MITDLVTPNATSPATPESNGMMSAADKAKLDGIDVATSEDVGLVKPDNETVTVNNGVLSALGGSVNLIWEEIKGE